MCRGQMWPAPDAVQRGGQGLEDSLLGVSLGRPRRGVKPWRDPSPQLPILCLSPLGGDPRREAPKDKHSYKAPSASAFH